SALAEVLRRGVLGGWGEVPASEIARWARLLPASWEDRPEVLLALGLELLARSPLDAVPLLVRASASFRARGDLAGELAALSQEAIVRFWANDSASLLGLLARATELAGAGSPSAGELVRIGAAAMARL